MTHISSVAIVGLGYVGLPLTVLANKKDLTVYGLDIDESKINSLNNGVSYIEDTPDEDIKTGSATYSTDFSLVNKADVVVICVPTPVTEAKEPDLGPVKGAVKSVAPHIKDKALVVIESTINPGVCDEIVIPLLEDISGKTVGNDVYVAHCPERINPGDKQWNVSNINRVVGANSKPELDMAVAFYESIIDAQIKPMGSLKEAEAVKVVENSFRDVNIAFVNELAMSFHKLGINIENVIEGAATKPFSFMPHHPGCGVGGHCIPVDPYYLIEYAHGYGFEHDFLRLARSINESMPAFTVDLLTEELNKLKLPLKGTRVALLGLSYKANVGDDRESPSHVIHNLLKLAEADVMAFDPYIPAKSDVANLEEALSQADAIVLATGHDVFVEQLTPQNLEDHGIKVLVDGRNVLRAKTQEYKDHGILYAGIGV